MDFQKTADYHALMAISEMLVRAQTEKYILDDRKRMGISQGDENCANCRKFHQHYVINGVGRVVPIRYGHCFPCGRGAKNVAWEDNCKHFEPVEGKEVPT